MLNEGGIAYTKVSKSWLVEEKNRIGLSRMKKEETLEEKDRELRLVQESSLDESLERKHGNKFT